MATISENLQIIKNSTDAIKQAIIDKGGTVSGDITTWASAISGIETGGGGSSLGNNVLEFIGTFSKSGINGKLSGHLKTVPFGGHFLAIAWGDTIEIKHTLIDSISDTVEMTFTGSPIGCYLLALLFVPDHIIENGEIVSICEQVYKVIIINE